jgi:cytochrome c oxidase assembly factor CtaG/polyferredoxin
MSPTLDAALGSWPFDPWLLATILAAAAIYFRGWNRLRRRDPSRWPAARPTAFCAGLAAIYLALASPIEPFASLLLQVHMLQHLLLTMVVPPLIWLGAPLLPLVNGLPRWLRREVAAPLLRTPELQALGARLTHPVAALLLFTAVTWLWHIPAAYEAALRTPWLHVAQHVSFLTAALLFWYPVVRPEPARPQWSAWLLLPYLLLADIQNTVLAALFTFSDRVLYPHYEQVPRLAGITALADQHGAGVLMWVPGSIAFLVPLLWIGVRLFLGVEPASATSRRSHTVKDAPLPSISARRRLVGRSETASVARPAFDLLRVPVIGAVLRWRHFRTTVQLITAGLAALVVYDGLYGPQVGAMNLAGVLPWIHWRGLLVLSLLVAGNFACFACPFTLARKLTDRWLPPGRAWPRLLRNKWSAVVLSALFFWSYEAFSLWDSPWLTAWIAIGYFVAALVIDVVFRSGSFCKYVCPIGQFNFVQSLASPLEVRVRDATVCETCTTHECLHGTPSIPGCRLQLFQPQKQGNLDCTFCLDCVGACPSRNVGVLAVVPTTELVAGSFRSKLGRLATGAALAPRADHATLILVLVFAAFLNAAGMVGPVVAWRDRCTEFFGLSSHLLATSMFYFTALGVVVPLGLAAAALLSRRGDNANVGVIDGIARYAMALVPLGFAMWLAHYSFHFRTSWRSIIPVTQRFFGDFGSSLLGAPQWICACCLPVGDELLIGELLALDVGLLASLFVAWRIAERTTSSSDSERSDDGRSGATLRAFAPWGTLLMALFVLGVWIVFQPMEMRGTLSMGAE